MRRGIKRSVQVTLGIIASTLIGTGIYQLMDGQHWSPTTLIVIGVVFVGGLAVFNITVGG